MRRERGAQYVKRKCGGGEEADFKKHPPTQEEIYKCVLRLGCVSLEDIAFYRRKIVIRR